MEENTRWGVDAPLELWAKLKPLARQKRRDPTPAEKKLWHFLRQRALSDFKFRRQHAIERFIVDFYCASARLVVEVDGPIHDYTPEEDALRQEYLEGLGLRVIRFTNDTVLYQIDVVLQQIEATLHVE
jgi:very-short-patch-repair endonuclease